MAILLKHALKLITRSFILLRAQSNKAINLFSKRDFIVITFFTLLGMGGIVSSQSLRDMRKYAVVGILVLAAIVTPPDVITQVILFVVVYMLYEVSIWLVRMVEKKRDKQLAEDGYFDNDLDDE